MMTAAEAKEYVNQRFVELQEYNPTWTRVMCVNLIIEELRHTHNYILTTPTNHPIFSVVEDSMGLIFNVTGLVE